MFFQIAVSTLALVVVLVVKSVELQVNTAHFLLCRCMHVVNGGADIAHCRMQPTHTILTAAVP